MRYGVVLGVIFLLSLGGRQQEIEASVQVVEFEPHVIDARTRLRTAPYDQSILYGDVSTAERQKIVSQAVFIVEDVVIADIERVETRIDRVSMGSGVVIAIDEDTDSSLVLTAEHVCSDTYGVGEVVYFGRALVISTEKHVVTADGERLRAEVFYSDVANDICALEVSGIAGEPAEVGSFHPPRQALLLTAGAPNGHWGSGNINVVEGYFSGIMLRPILGHMGYYQFSIPVIGGMSGSGIYYRGQLVGIITIRSTRYGHIGWGPGINMVGPFIDQARSNWNLEGGI